MKIQKRNVEKVLVKENFRLLSINKRLLLFLLSDDVKETKPRAGSNIRSKDRKSPNTIQADGVPNDSDDDKKEPKVPPLKIVLSNSNEVDTNIR